MYILDCNYLTPYTTIRDQNNLQVLAFAATRSASCHIQWETIEISDTYN